MSIIGAEDEDFENDLEPTVDDQCSHFNSIELVKTRPTHLLVFLQHVMLQFDCAPLLCYLHADLFKNYSAKETKKQFLDFYNTFLDKGAILRVPVPSHVSYELDRTRPDLISEEVQKRYVQDIQVMVIPEVIMQLEDFRTKRMMGMTRHESELLEVESHHATERIPTEMKEKAVAETLLDRMADSQFEEGRLRFVIGCFMETPFMPLPLFLFIQNIRILFPNSCSLVASDKNSLNIELCWAGMFLGLWIRLVGNFCSTLFQIDFARNLNLSFVFCIARNTFWTKCYIARSL